jgi:hypothetical protein
VQKRFALVGFGKSDAVAIGFEFVVAVAGRRVGASGMGSDLNESGGPRGLHDGFGGAVGAQHGAWAGGMEARSELLFGQSFAHGGDCLVDWLAVLDHVAIPSGFI